VRGDLADRLHRALEELIARVFGDEAHVRDDGRRARAGGEIRALFKARDSFGAVFWRHEAQRRGTVDEVPDPGRRIPGPDRGDAHPRAPREFFHLIREFRPPELLVPVGQLARSQAKPAHVLERVAVRDQARDDPHFHLWHVCVSFHTNLSAL